MRTCDACSNPTDSRDLCDTCVRRLPPDLAARLVVRRRYWLLHPSSVGAHDRYQQVRDDAEDAAKKRLDFEKDTGWGPLHDAS